MLQSVRKSWPLSISFSTIILDYFFSPPGWVQYRWTDSFFKNTLPLLVKENILDKNGTIWLPNIDHIKLKLCEFKDILDEYYNYKLVKNPNVNPLYQGS